MTEWVRSMHGCEGRTISRIRLAYRADIVVGALSDTTYDGAIIEFTDGSMLKIEERSQTGEIEFCILPIDVAAQLRNMGYPADGAE